MNEISVVGQESLAKLKAEKDETKDAPPVEGETPKEVSSGQR